MYRNQLSGPRSFILPHTESLRALKTSDDMTCSRLNSQSVIRTLISPFGPGV